MSEHEFDLQRFAELRRMIEAAAKTCGYYVTEIEIDDDREVVRTRLVVRLMQGAAPEKLNENHLAQKADR